MDESQEHEWAVAAAGRGLERRCVIRTPGGRFACPRKDGFLVSSRSTWRLLLDSGWSVDWMPGTPKCAGTPLPLQRARHAHRGYRCGLWAGGKAAVGGDESHQMRETPNREQEWWVVQPTTGTGSLVQTLL